MTRNYIYNRRKIVSSFVPTNLRRNHAIKGHSVEIVPISGIGFCVKIDGQYQVDKRRDRQIRMYSSPSAALQGARKDACGGEQAAPPHCTVVSRCPP